MWTGETIREWARRRWIVSIPTLLAVAYFIVFHIYWLGGHSWTHPARWWHELAEAEQAAWFGAIGTVSAILGTFWLAKWQFGGEAGRAAEAVAVLLAKLDGSRRAMSDKLGRMKASANVDRSQIGFMHVEGKRFMDRLHRLDTSMSVLGLSAVAAVFTVEDDLADLLAYIEDDQFWQNQWPMSFVLGTHPVLESDVKLANSIKEAQKILETFQ